jgi:hypothetical protein
MRAATRRRGVVMVGQLRWQWPVAMHVHPGSSGSPPRGDGVQDAGLILITGAFRTAGKPALRLFGGDLSGPIVAGQVSLLVGQAIVRFRLDRAVALGLDEAATRRLGGLAGTGGAGTDGEAWRGRLPGPLLLWFLTNDEYQSADAQSIAAGKVG